MPQGFLWCCEHWLSIYVAYMYDAFFSRRFTAKKIGIIVVQKLNSLHIVLGILRLDCIFLMRHEKMLLENQHVVGWLGGQ
jgi:hypothetical protein